MEIKGFASSSDGNMYLVADGVTNILIECGITIKRIIKYVDITTISGCIISHEHQDHSKAALKLSEYAINIYASKGTLSELGMRKNVFAKVVKPMELFLIGTFTIIPFPTQHDAAEPLGYFIKSTVTNETLLFATDTYYINPRFAGINYLMIECNYDINVLEERYEKGDVCKKQYDRLRLSHFEIHDVLKFLKSNDLSQLRRIYLIHLSSHNAREIEFVKIIKEATGIPVEVFKEVR